MDAVKLPAWYQLPNDKSSGSTVVIGGGLAGFACAYALCQRGMSVTLLEKSSDLLSGASGNLAGMVMPQFAAKANTESLFYQRAFEFTQQQLARLQNDNISKGLTGILYLAANPRLMQRIDRYQKAKGDSEQIVAVNAAQASECAGVPLQVGGLLLKQAGWLSARDLVEALLGACQDKLTVKMHTEVIELQYHATQWQLKTAQGETLAADRVIIANADAITRLSICQHLPIMPVAGQLQMIAANEFTTHLKLTLCGESYLLPAIAGQHVLGASFRQSASDLSVQMADYQANLLQLSVMSPPLSESLAKQAWTARVSIRATTPDHLPLIGPLVERNWFMQAYQRLQHGDRRCDYPPVSYLPGLYVSCGFGARGLTACLLAGDVIASLICQQALPIGLELYQAIHPARFYLRELRKSFF
jgi:tRNA 5-methylaminomethyl-2-thiouridine biosynthesis bifunctional protein